MTPEPLTPANCDLRDFPRMMIDIPRLRGSEFDSIADDSAWRAGVNLWITSWHSVPAASLDDNDEALCRAAGLGRDLRAWRRLREKALRGWTLCSDGRWYHATVAEFALEAWLQKLAQRRRSAEGNAKRWNTPIDVAPFDDAVAVATGLLKALNPDARALAKASRQLSSQRPSGIPQGVLQGSQEKGKEKEKEKGIMKKEEGSAPVPGALPAVVSPTIPPVILLPTNLPNIVFPVTEEHLREFATLYPGVDVLGQLRAMRGWLLSNATNRKTARGIPAFINRWLSKEQDRSKPNGAGHHHQGGGAARNSFADVMSEVVAQRTRGGLFDPGGDGDRGATGEPVSRIDRDKAIDVETEPR